MSDCVPLVDQFTGKVIGNISLSTGRTEYKGRERKKRWCFECRQRTWYRNYVFFPKSLYYGPHAGHECERCEQDACLFPGQWHEQADEF